MELHGEGATKTTGTEGEEGAAVERPEGYEPPIQDSVWDRWYEVLKEMYILEIGDNSKEIKKNEK